MDNRWLRRLSVRQRILAMMILLAVGLILPIPFLVVQQNRVLAEQQTLVQDIVNIDRSILLASTHVAASQTNLEQYIQSSLPTLDEARAEADAAMFNLDAARALASDAGGRLSQQAAAVLSAATAYDVAGIQELRLDLQSYRDLIGQLQAAALVEDVSVPPGLETEALTTAEALGSRLEAVVGVRDEVLDAVNQASRRAAQQRLLTAAAVELGAMVIVSAIAILISRSITGPIAALGDAAQRLEQDDLDISLSAEGQDELAFLARVLNNMAARLSASYQAFEQRIAERIGELERRSEYMSAVIDVSRATTDILDAEVLLRRAVDVIRQRFGLYYVGLFLVDEGRQVIVLRAGTGEAGRAMVSSGHQLRFGEGMVGWCVANARPRVSLNAADDVMRVPNPYLPDTSSEAAIPLRVRGRVIGALTVQDDQPLSEEQVTGARRHRFDPEAIALLQVMADLLAVAIENARLLNEVQVSLDAAQRAYGQMTREGWLRVLRGRTTGVVMGPDGEIQIVEEALSDGGGASVRSLADADDAVGATAAAQSPAWSSDLQAAWQSREPVQHDNLLSVPIIARDVVLGALRLTKVDEAWTDREMALVQTIVDQLGLALDSARLYEDTQIRAARERVARDITDHMRATVDWDDLMQTAVAEIGEAVVASRVFVQWLPPDQVASDGENRGDEVERVQLRSEDRVGAP